VAQATQARFKIEFGPFTADLRSGELRKRGIRIKLQDRPFRILAMLLEQPGEVVTRDEIRARLWPEGTFVDFDSNISSALGKLRTALGDSAATPRYIETVGRGYRFLGEVRQDTSPTLLPDQKTAHPTHKRLPNHRVSFHLWLIGTIAATGILASLFAARVYLKKRSVGLEGNASAFRLTEKDTVVLADFTNRTGDPVFDGTLKEALAIELTQSPLLNVASDLQVRETLKRMGRPSQDSLPPQFATEVCVRMGGKAILAGTISVIGKLYLVGLEALACNDGQTLGAYEAQAETKKDVLRALGESTSALRVKLGESLPSVQKYDFPVNATTKSLDALKAFSMGLKAERDTGVMVAIPFYKNAIEIDPDFALAYAVLGRAYEDYGEDEQAIRNYTRAFELRDRLGERERYFVTTLYNETVTGDLEAAKEAGELWTKIYPRDGYAREKLGTIYFDAGDIQQGYEQMEQAFSLFPQSGINVYNLVLSKMNFDRLDDAAELLRSAGKEGLEGEELHFASYWVAFLRRDSVGMDRELAWAMGKPGIEPTQLEQHSESEAFFGRLNNARGLSRRARNAAIRDGQREVAAHCDIIAALREIELGLGSKSNALIRSGLSIAVTKDTKIQAALAFARAGNQERAYALLNEVQRLNPLNTLVKSYWAPAIRAAIRLSERQSRAAVSELEAAAPYEWSQAGMSPTMFMYPVYIRGQAYLEDKNGIAAAREFRKILQHPGVTINGLLGALARLQLARAELMIGDRQEARKWYEDFLALWKDADNDLPILIQARFEYKKAAFPGR